MIDVRETLDVKGNYIVQGGGRSAPTLGMLAEALGVPESELRFRPKLLDKKPKLGSAYLNHADRVAARSEFDPF